MSERRMRDGDVTRGRREAEDDRYSMDPLFAVSRTAIKERTLVYQNGNESRTPLATANLSAVLPGEVGSPERIIRMSGCT